MSRYTTKKHREFYPECELIAYFPPAGWRRRGVPNGSRIDAVPCPITASQTHHVIGGTKRTDDVRNMVAVCNAVHDFAHAESKVFLVLCLHRLMKRGDLDWEFLSTLRSNVRPGALEVEGFVEKCAAFPWVDRFRLELLDNVRKGQLT